MASKERKQINITAETHAMLTDIRDKLREYAGGKYSMDDVIHVLCTRFLDNFNKKQ